MGYANLALQMWSLIIQLVMTGLIFCFFLFLSRQLKLQEVRSWAGAWGANLAALTFVMLTAFAHPPAALARLGMGGYAFAKTMFVLLILSGAREHVTPGSAPPLEMDRSLLWAGLWSLCLGLFSPHIATVQLGMSFLVGSLMTLGAIWLLMRPRSAMSRWLGWAMLLEGALFLHYVPILAPLAWGGRILADYMQASSFLDAGAELVVALSSLVALQSTTHRNLEELNLDLLLSRERLRQLVDTDPLTNLLNRRGFREEMKKREGYRNVLIFIDLDDFKLINDRWGHAVGDACLKRVATALLRTFRPDDALFRWGGDEFLVVCRGMGTEQALQRLEVLRAGLRVPQDGCPSIHLSAGVSVLEADMIHEEALRTVDERMYADKAFRRSHDVSGRFRTVNEEDIPLVRARRSP